MPTTVSSIAYKLCFWIFYHKFETGAKEAHSGSSKRKSSTLAYFIIKQTKGQAPEGKTKLILKNPCKLQGFLQRSILVVAAFCLRRCKIIDGLVRLKLMFRLWRCRN